MAVLGSLMIAPNAAHDVSTIVQPNDFYVVKHGWVYEAILDLHERREPFDYVTVCDELGRRGRLDELGGVVYLSQLVNGVPTAIHVEAYARIVRRTAQRRHLISAAGEIAKAAYDEEISADEAIDRAEAAVFGVARHNQRGVLRHVGPDLSEYYDFVSSRSGDPLGIPTGLVDLDRVMRGGGLPRSALVVVAARPSMGKSALLLRFALNAARRGKRAALFSLEMSREQIAQRLVSIESGIDGRRLDKGDLTEQEWEGFADASAALSELPFYLDDTPGVTPLEVRGKARRLHAEHGLDLVLVDYLQLMAPGRRLGNREQEVAYMSQSLKALARELDVPVVAASQLNRSLEHRRDKRPTLADLRESGAIENDADLVMFIYRDEYYDEETDTPGIAEVIVGKQRNGPTGKVDLFFNKTLTRFDNAEVYARDLGF
jgi:replicative DNA helicase